MGQNIMMHLHEELRDRALQLINTKSTIDDIKAGKDLALINDVANKMNISPEYINDGIELDIKLNREYPEIQLLCDAAKNMQNFLGTNVKEITYSTVQDNVFDALATDYFGILASILIKHNAISAIKDFIRAVD